MTSFRLGLYMCIPSGLDLQIQRLFKYIDDISLINQLLAPFEVGHEVDTMAKAHSFVTLSVTPTFGRTFRQDWRKNKGFD